MGGGRSWPGDSGDKKGGGDESGGFDQRSYEQSGIADARVSRKTSLNPVRVVSHPTLETSSNETTEVGGEWWFGKVRNS